MVRLILSVYPCVYSDSSNFLPVELDVYKAADENNVTIVGGAARSVGAAGGWVQGGGHSPLSGLHGLGVDSTFDNRLSYEQI
jgi:hypothetical protein